MSSVPAPAGVLLAAARLLSAGDPQSTADGLGLLRVHCASARHAGVEMFMLLHALCRGYYGGEYYFTQDPQDRTPCSDAVIALVNATREADLEAVQQALDLDGLHPRCMVLVAAQALADVAAGPPEDVVELNVPDHLPDGMDP